MIKVNLSSPSVLEPFMGPKEYKKLYGSKPRKKERKEEKEKTKGKEETENIKCF